FKNLPGKTDDSSDAHEVGGLREVAKKTCCKVPPLVARRKLAAILDAGTHRIETTTDLCFRGLPSAARSRYKSEGVLDGLEAGF
ncbi:MAG: hypothetical protein WB987_07255, partial [Candidatus Acidiferrales bacterium]